MIEINDSKPNPFDGSGDVTLDTSNGNLREALYKAKEITQSNWNTKKEMDVINGKQGIALVPGVADAMNAFVHEVYVGQAVPLPPNIESLAVQLLCDNMRTFYLYFTDLFTDEEVKEKRRNQPQSCYGSHRIGVLNVGEWDVCFMSKRTFLGRLISCCGEGKVYAALASFINKSSKGAVSSMSFAGVQIGEVSPRKPGGRNK